MIEEAEALFGHHDVTAHWPSLPPTPSWIDTSGVSLPYVTSITPLRPQLTARDLMAGAKSALSTPSA